MIMFLFCFGDGSHDGGNDDDELTVHTHIEIYIHTSIYIYKTLANP